MEFKVVRTRDGKRYVLPKLLFQDFGSHYLIDFVAFQRHIPKGAVDSETEFSVLSVLKTLAIIIFALLVLNAVF